jgi:hypothetical protein
VKPFPEFVRLYSGWLWEPGSVLLGVVVGVLPPLVFPFAFSHTPDAYKIWAAVLQFLGVGFVVKDIRDRLQLAGYSFTAWRNSWLARKPTRKEPHVINAPGGASHAAAGSPSLNIHAAAQSVPTLEQRIEMLETNLVALKADMLTRTDDLSRKISTVSDRVRQERKERERQHRLITDAISKVKDHTVGSFRGDIVGIAWVLVGIVLGGVPDKSLIRFADSMHRPVLGPTVEAPLNR